MERFKLGKEIKLKKIEILLTSKNANLPACRQGRLKVRRIMSLNAIILSKIYSNLGDPSFFHK
jgi:hypothetical protein